MGKVEIYTSPLCGFCHAAKRLLDAKGVGYREFDISIQPSLKAEMISRGNGRVTVPQIFINNTGIGGCNELYALESSGKLMGMLKA